MPITIKETSSHQHLLEHQQPAVLLRSEELHAERMLSRRMPHQLALRSATLTSTHVQAFEDGLICHAVLSRGAGEGVDVDGLQQDAAVAQRKNIAARLGLLRGEQPPLRRVDRPNDVGASGSVLKLTSMQ
jgi:hypothetical protein